MSGIVKALEWEDCDELGLCADTIIGRYWMEPDGLQSTSWQLRLITIKSEEKEQLILARGQVSAAATQAFAQADIEKRISSILDPSYASSQAEIRRLKGKLTNCVHALTFAIDGWDESDPLIQKLRATRDGAQTALSGSKE